MRSANLLYLDKNTVCYWVRKNPRPSDNAPFIWLQSCKKVWEKKCLHVTNNPANPQHQLCVHSNRFYLMSHFLPGANTHNSHNWIRDNRLRLYNGELRSLDYLQVVDLSFSPSITKKHKNLGNQPKYLVSLWEQMNQNTLHLICRLNLLNKSPNKLHILDSLSTPKKEKSKKTKETVPRCILLKILKWRNQTGGVDM